MRLPDSTNSQVPLPDSSGRPDAAEMAASSHPVLRRALEAHRGDQVRPSGVDGGRGALSSEGARSRLVRFSSGFLGDARRAGLTAPEVRAALGSGVRKRCWDGCLLVQDWFQGVELKLDPSGRFGLAVRRTHAVN